MPNNVIRCSQPSPIFHSISGKKTGSISPDRKISLWNKSAEKKTGYKLKNIINKSIKEINLFENIDEIEDYLKTIISGKKSYQKEIMINTTCFIPYHACNFNARRQPHTKKTLKFSALSSDNQSETWKYCGRKGGKQTPATRVL